MKTFATDIRVLATLLLAITTVPALGCDEEEEDDDGRTYACRYDYSTYSVSEYGTDFEESTDNCTEVSSPETCDTITESSNECHEGFCAEWTYTNVSVAPGSCYGASGGGSDEESDEGCEWSYDGECDEPEGTGLCADGTDYGDC